MLERFSPVKCSTSHIRRRRAASSCCATVFCWCVVLSMSGLYCANLAAYTKSVYMYTCSKLAMRPELVLTDIGYSTFALVSMSDVQLPISLIRFQRMDKIFLLAQSHQ